MEVSASRVWEKCRPRRERRKKKMMKRTRSPLCVRSPTSAIQVECDARCLERNRPGCCLRPTGLASEDACAPARCGRSKEIQKPQGRMPPFQENHKKIKTHIDQSSQFRQAASGRRRCRLSSYQLALESDRANPDPDPVI